MSEHDALLNLRVLDQSVVEELSTRIQALLEDAGSTARALGDTVDRAASTRHDADEATAALDARLRLGARLLSGLNQQTERAEPLRCDLERQAEASVARAADLDRKITALTAMLEEGQRKSDGQRSAAETLLAEFGTLLEASHADLDDRGERVRKDIERNRQQQQAIETALAMLEQRLTEGREELDERRRRADQATARLEQRLADLEAHHENAAAELKERGRAAEAIAAALEQRMAGVRGEFERAHTDLEARVAAAERCAADLHARRDEIATQIDEAVRRLTALRDEAETTGRCAEERLERFRSELTAAVVYFESRKDEVGKATTTLETLGHDIQRAAEQSAQTLEARGAEMTATGAEVERRLAERQRAVEAAGDVLDDRAAALRYGLEQERLGAADAIREAAHRARQDIARTCADRLEELQEVLDAADAKADALRERRAEAEHATERRDAEEDARTERLRAIEQRVTETSDVLRAELEARQAEMSALRADIQRRAEEVCATVNAAPAAVEARIESIVQEMAEQRARINAVADTLERRAARIVRRLDEQAAEAGHSLDHALAERMHALDRRRADDHARAERLRALEQGVEEAVGVLRGEVEAQRGAIEEQAAAARRGIEDALAAHAQFVEHDRLGEEARGERLLALERCVSETVTALGAVSRRREAFEARIDEMIRRIEATADERRAAVDRTVEALTTRLDTVAAENERTTPVEQVLAEHERAAEQLAGSLAELRTTLAARDAERDASIADLASWLDELDARLAHAVDAPAAELADRLAQLERAIDEGLDLDGFEERLEELRGAVQARTEAEIDATRAHVDERIDRLDEAVHALHQGRSMPAPGDGAAPGDEKARAAIDKLGAQLERTRRHLETETAQLGRDIPELRAGLVKLAQRVEERLGAVAGAPANPGDVSGVEPAAVEARLADVESRFDTLTRQMDARLDGVLARLAAEDPGPRTVAPSLPSPLDERCRAFLEAVESGDHGVVGDFIEAHYAATARGEMPLEQRIMIYQRIRQRTGGLDPVELTTEGPHRVVILAQARRKRRRYRVELQLEPEQPHGIVSAIVDPVG